MTDAEAAEVGIFEALKAEVSLASVWQHVPLDTPPPVVIIGDLSGEEAGGKDGWEDFTVEIITMRVDDERAGLLALQGEVKIALHDRTLIVEDFAFRALQIGRDGQLLPDGATYYGSQTFKLIRIS